MTALIIVGWLLGWVLLWRMPKLRAPRRDGTESRISVVIPVRNEVIASRCCSRASSANVVGPTR